MKYILLLLIMFGSQAFARQPVTIKECSSCQSNSSFANQARSAFVTSPTKVIVFNSNTRQVKYYEVIKEDENDLHNTGLPLIYPVDLGVPGDLLSKMQDYIDAYNILKNEQDIQIPPYGIPGSVGHPSANIHSVTDMIRTSAQQQAFMNWLQSRANFQNFLREQNTISSWVIDKVFDVGNIFFNQTTIRFTVTFNDDSQVDVEFKHLNNRYEIKLETARDQHGNRFPHSSSQASSGGQYIVTPTTYSVWSAWLSGLGFAVDPMGGVPAKIECDSSGRCIITPL